MRSFKSYTSKHKVFFFIFAASVLFVLVSRQSQNKQGLLIEKNKTTLISKHTPLTLTQEKSQKTAVQMAGEKKHNHINMRTEILKIKALVGNFPQSKPQLISIITSENPFHSKKKEAKAHSREELLQRKAGAVKILALRKLVELEKDKTNLMHDLITISRNAKDPSLAKIAKASLLSLEQGRSFFDDFRNGVNTEMPL